MTKPITVEEVKKVIDVWFESDLDIGDYYLVSGRQRLLITFESDVYYEHINDPDRGVTVKSIRHRGHLRRLIVYEGPDSLYRQVKDLCNKEYTKEELLQLVDDLAKKFKFVAA